MSQLGRRRKTERGGRGCFVEDAKEWRLEGALELLQDNEFIRVATCECGDAAA
jgi:hypothetical protein